MIKILAVSPLKFDGTSFYRAWGVFKDLAERVDIEVTDYVQRMGGWNWADFAMHDILFLQRPGTDEHYKLAHYCKDLGLKIWVDYDDNFFVLPPENRMHDAVNPERKKKMADIIKLADVITVSTEALKKFMLATGAKQVEVVPNALNTKLFKPVKAYNNKRPAIPPNPARQVYAWRGSDTHHLDLYDYQIEMSEAIKARPDVNWMFFGFNPVFITRGIASVGGSWQYVHPDDIFGYWKKLKMSRPELMHVVLTANEFNLNKSNIAWIEATAAGAVCVGPAWPEWVRPGLINYETPEQYQEILINANDLPLQKRWQESMDYINENLLLSTVNEKRADVVERLMANHVEIGLSGLPTTMIE